MAATSSADGRHHVPEDVRMPGHQLVVHPPGHVGQREPALLGGQHGVEVDLEEKVAQLLGQMVDRLRRRRPVPLAATASMASSVS